MTDEITTPDAIHCPNCKSTNWRCWDERTRFCWDSEGRHVDTIVIGGLVCNDCGHDWLNYGGFEIPDDCECEDWDD